MKLLVELDEVEALVNRQDTALGALDTSCSDRLEADDGPLWLATRDFLEARFVVHGLCPEPHVLGIGASRFVDRVCLNQRGALLFGIGDGSLEGDT